MPDDVVTACRAHDPPLVAVPEHVPFATLTALVGGRLDAARGDRLAATPGRRADCSTPWPAGSGWTS